MKYRELGETGIKLPPFLFGGNVFGWNVEEQDAFRLLDFSFDHGFNAIDTADIYSYWKSGNTGGESETIIGNWLKTKHRDQVIIHTKGGAPDAPGELSNANLSEKYLIKAVEASLKRLGTDYIDLYYTHYDDNQTPPEETLGALQKLISQGKIKAIGASNINPERFQLFLDSAKQNHLPRYACLQTLYNLHDRQDFELNYQQLCISEGVGVLSYFSLAHGFLSGKYRSSEDLIKSSARGSSITPYLTPRGHKILDALDRVAQDYQVKPSQIAIAWLLAQQGLTAPVASATNILQLQDLINATQLSLDQSALELLCHASSYEEVIH
ncbi:aldo/keto reductase [Acinetobacter sp. ANC 4635]|uniref:aldo/keto reductase n=1 Tax=Acinetobacter sp. ANC 4635 TaxID=2529846 RepID=UPI00103A90A1|nr:aldo/keto reductase [Acinetobacter sp. ANC 4635]TCB24238.1 aldo/keto reductase [Acinetobacter sp. ANC 4635]